MKTIKVYYSSYNKDILKEVEEFNQVAFVEVYSINNRKEMKKVKQAMEDYGTKNLPFIVFEDENFEGVGAIWSEQKPTNWKEEITKKLNEI